MIIYLFIEYLLITSINGDKCNDGFIHFHQIYGIDSPFYIQDQKVSLITLRNVDDYSILTCPKGIAFINQSIIPDAGLGVFAAIRIEEGTYFGPYGGQKMKNEIDDGSYAWAVYNDLNEFVYYVDAFHQSKSNWLRFINCPDIDYQQNLVPIEYDGEIYYQAIRDIHIGEELFAYYGDHYANYLGINTSQLFEYTQHIYKLI